MVREKNVEPLDGDPWQIGWRIEAGSNAIECLLIHRKRLWGLWPAKPREPFSMPWQQIRRVVAYKVDLMTFDSIYFDFEMDDGYTYRLTEDQPGWRHLMSHMADHLPGFDRDWYSKVYYPPFEPCETEIYRRDQTSAN